MHLVNFPKLRIQQYPQGWVPEWYKARDNRKEKKIVTPIKYLKWCYRLLALMASGLIILAAYFYFTS